MPQIVSNALTTLARVKIFLGISSDTYDGLFIMLINQATEYIENYTHRLMKEATRTEEVYDGTGGESIVLRNFPVTAFTKLEYNGSGDGSEDWVEFDSTDYYWETDGRLILVGGKFSKKPKGYRATYTAGYKIDFDNEANTVLHTLPAGLEMACLRLISALFNSRRAAGIQSETLGDQSVTYSKVLLDDNDLKLTLDRYVSVMV